MTSASSPRPVSALRARMIEDMTVRGFTEETRSNYIREVRAFAAFIRRPPDTATAEDLRRFQLHQTQTGMQPPSINSAVAALRFFRRHRGQVRSGLSPGGRWIRTSGTADDARLLADLYTHNASRQMPQKGSSDQAVACLRRLGAGVVGSAAVCAFRFRPPGTGSKRAGWRRSGAIFAFFGAVCFEPDASRARLRFKAVMRSMTGGGAAISLGLTVSPFILASISSCKASW
jgi:hypothetical protein